MRLGIVCYPTFGGSGVVATELARALDERGHDLHVISYDLPGRLADSDHGVRFHRVEVKTYPLFEYPPYSLALATKIVDVARHHELDVLHVHYAVPNAVSAILAQQILAPRHLPVVTTLHGTDVTLVGNDPSYLETTRFGVLRSDAVTAVSEWLRRTTLEQLAIDREIEVIPNFVDPETFGRKPPRDSHRFRRGDEALLVHVSNFRRVKRVGDTLDILERVRARRPCRLLLVGDGPERAEVEAQARQRGLAEDIVFVGQVSEIEEVLWGADLFLLPSSTESFGLAALEALACAVPVIGTRVGGVPDVVVDGEHGHLFEVGEVDGMAQAALRLLEHPEEREALGRAGRAWAFEHFRREVIVDRYYALYERVRERAVAAMLPGSAGGGS